MKKTLFYVGAALAMVFSLNSCNKEIENPNENNDKKGIPFEIVANPVETRTENDGMDTKWVTNDAINVFHAVTNSSTPTFVNDGEFTIDDPSTNKFNGELAEALSASAYNWFMFYPYNVNITTPANRGDDGYVTVGSMATRNQTQIGNGSKAHLAGKNVPLYGKIANVASSTMPSVTVNQICSFIEFNVTNNSGKDLTVTEIKFTGTEDVAGTYFIDFTGDNVVFTPSGDNYVSAIETLDVTEGAAIANGASAAFYMAIKPFTTPSTCTLKVSVNGYEKEINLTKTTSFSAGKIKKINFNYDKAVTTEDATFIFNTEDGLTELGIEIPTSPGTGTSLDGKNLVKNGISLALSSGSGSTDPSAWNKSSALQLRTYVGNTLTFTAPFGYTVTEIVFSSDGTYTASTGTWNAPTWSGEASVVTLTRTGSSRHEVNTIKVTCTKQAPKVLASIELSGNYQTEFYVNDVFDNSGLVVTAHYTDGTQQQVSPTSVSGPDMSVAANNVPVTVTYTEGEVTKTASYTVNVIARPIYTVTLADDNTELTAELGESVSLPSRSIEGYTFEGWSVTEVSQPTTTAPELIEVGSYSPTASITLYPVFSSGENTTVWAKMDLDALTAGTYVLVSFPNNYAFNGTITSGHGQKTSTAINFDTSGHSTSIPNDACLLELISVTGGFKLYNSEFGYLYASKATSGGLSWHDNDNSYWYGDKDNSTILYKANSAHLRCYNDTFRTYTNNTNNGIALAKQTTIVSKTYISNPE